MSELQKVPEFNPTPEPNGQGVVCPVCTNPINRPTIKMSKQGDLASRFDAIDEGKRIHLPQITACSWHCFTQGYKRSMRESLAQLETGGPGEPTRLIQDGQVQISVGSVKGFNGGFDGSIPGIDDFATTKQACGYLNICRRTLLRWVKQGRIERVMFGTNIRYRKRDIVAMGITSK